jgi:hypothetical protein
MARRRLTLTKRPAKKTDPGSSADDQTPGPIPVHSIHLITAARPPNIGLPSSSSPPANAWSSHRRHLASMIPFVPRRRPSWAASPGPWDGPVFQASPDAPAYSEDLERLGKPRRCSYISVRRLGPRRLGCGCHQPRAEQPQDRHFICARRAAWRLVMLFRTSLLHYLPRMGRELRRLHLSKPL